MQWQASPSLGGTTAAVETFPRETDRTEAVLNPGTAARNRQMDPRKHAPSALWTNPPLRHLSESFLLLAVLFVTLPAWTRSSPQRSVDQILGSLPAARGFSAVAISPDGSKVAWVSDAGIFVTDCREAASKPQKIAEGGELAWSPDSRRLAFLSGIREKSQQQVYIVNATGGEARKLTNVKGALDNLKWSPDGKSLAFLLLKNAPSNPMAPMQPFLGVIHEQTFEQRLAVVELGSERVRLVSPSGLCIYQYDWSPDGKSVTAVAAYGPAYNNHYVAQLYRINVSSGDATSILKPHMQIAGPRWSPDGKQIAFVGGLMSGFGAGRSGGGDIYVVPAVEGLAKDITPQMKATAWQLVWLSPHRLLFSETVFGNNGLAEVDLPDGRIGQLWRGSAQRGALGGLSVARDGKTTAVILSSFDRPPEVWAGAIGAWKQVTQLNQGVSPSWGKVESLEWPSDGWQVQSWLYYPAHYNPAGRYPMIVEVHGGPTGTVVPGWGGDSAAFSAAGYFVLVPNYVGSAGEGEPFKKGIVKEFGYADFRSIVAGIDKVLETLPVDKNRIGITGWSNGGFMTMWGVARSHLFHAAVAGAACPSDWLSYTGESDISNWELPYFGGVWPYKDLAIYARSAPMTFVKNVKTPTLMLVGEHDGECPAPQSIEFWGALKILGVKAQLVIYPGEGHDFNRARDRRDALRRTIEWFNQYLK
jgi:dipeptidyl aminopeptidase/acylaminoacyl peptidase